MRKFTDKVVKDRLLDFRKMTIEEAKEMAENYGKGKV